MTRANAASLYDARFEHDACGVGFVARSSGAADRSVVDMGLTALGRLAHRGAVAADGLSGDGAGVLTQVPLDFLLRDVLVEDALHADQPVGVAMLFVPADDGAVHRALGDALERHGLRIAGWRDVPVDPDALGSTARGSMPLVRQAFVQSRARIDEPTLERRLYLARKTFERDPATAATAYICSMSCRTIVYKALSSGIQLARFYPDLADPSFTSAFAMFHQRYSTNTLPTWNLAQPLRLLAHNGEINTLWGNRAWLDMRAAELPPELQPLYTPTGSDSATLDEALELITRNGRDVHHALSMLIVPSWEDRIDDLSPGVVAFHRYHAALIEPWDGPAALAFSDGRYVGAALDRNGLRPCRFEVTRDGIIAAGSEVGLFDLPQDDIVQKGRLGPGQMLLVDLAQSRVLTDDMVREELAQRANYGALCGARPLRADADEVATAVAVIDAAALNVRQHLFGFSAEDVRIVITPMAEEGKEATWSMGDDTPVPPLARSPRPFYAFLRQRFAQVTNPPIDPLRERCVMSLRGWLGPRPSLLVERTQTAVYELPSPVLLHADWTALEQQAELRIARIECTFDPRSEMLGAAIVRVCERAANAVRDGAHLLMLDDRDADTAVAPVPMLFAVGAVHQHLLRVGLRGRTGIVAAAGDACDVHHIAALLGSGGAAVYPWLAEATAQSMAVNGAAQLQSALEHGLRKVLSRLGISALASYRCGQLFEVLGLADEVVDHCFAGTPSRIAGIGWDEIQRMAMKRQDAAVQAAQQSAKLPDYGQVRFRRNDHAELHTWQPRSVRALQRAVASPDGDDAAAAVAAADEAWQEFRSVTDDAVATNLRDLLDFTAAAEPLSRDDVEGEPSIVKRFVLSAMSLGALSPEAHGALTLAMNRLGARSNTGEGGEDRELYGGTGRERRDSRIKQIASGRFGVTAEYLAHADEIEIKIAQGSKPGEGGQLPGHKVTDLIARLRHTQQGVPLISPPPHHDIYSIEDIAQLIYDLKTVNPRAAVGVKLVAQAGVGTVAAGVAKADADFVTISGWSGGTGASPLSSIKNAGVPWELGLAETQQTLMRNGLRHRIRVRTDGGIVNARDVMIAVLLGADEYGFGTAPLVALGCDMARQCHLNTCPTGIATQREDLRAKFTGTPEQVMRYFVRLASDVRDLLAMLGLGSVQDAVGRTDLLRQTRTTANIDLTRMLARETAPAGTGPRFTGVEGRQSPAVHEGEFAQHVLHAMSAGIPIDAVSAIGNHERTVGAQLAGQIALRHGRDGLAPGTVTLHFHGCAGQSFGAFAVRGMLLVLDGEANDYVGKGLSGGEIVLRPRGAARRAPDRNVILGNVALYGATSGRLFAAGSAGERFAVRNSGATAVVEGVGDHGCEYMTGGTVIVLGGVGRNFGAGMTGGSAYVLDRTGRLPQCINSESVVLAQPDEDELATIRALIGEHRQATGSRTAQALLANWTEDGRAFWSVRPVGAGAEVVAAAAVVVRVNGGV